MTHSALVMSGYRERIYPIPVWKTTMADARGMAIAIERRYRMLSNPWREIIAEIRAERGSLLASAEFSDLVGVERSDALDALDSRLRTAEDLVRRCEDERHQHPFLVRRWLKSLSTMTDDELEGNA